MCLLVLLILISLAPTDLGTFRIRQQLNKDFEDLIVGFSHLNPTPASKAFCGSRPWSNSMYCWETEQCPSLVITMRRIIAKERYFFYNGQDVKRNKCIF